MTEFKYCVYCEDEPAICFNTEAEAMKFAREDTSMHNSVRVEKSEINDAGEVLNTEVIWTASGNNIPEKETVSDNEFETEFPESDIANIDTSDDIDYDELARQYAEDPADWIDDNKLIKEAVDALEENEDEVECKICFELGPKAEMKKLDIGYVCPKCAQELHSHQGTNLDLIDSDPFSLDYEDPRDFDEPEEEEVKEEPVDENEVRKFEAGIEEKLEEHINDRPADIESDQVLQGTDNAVVDCEAAKVIAHSEDEKPLDCKMEKPALEEPLAGEKVDTKLNEELKVIIDFSEYKPWSGAVDTYELIKDADKLDELEAYLEDCYPDGVTATQINDILWFDSDQVLSYLGLGDVEDEDEEVDESLKEYWQEDNDPMNWSDKEPLVYSCYYDYNLLGYLEYPYMGYENYPTTIEDDITKYFELPENFDREKIGWQNVGWEFELNAAKPYIKVEENLHEDVLAEEAPELFHIKRNKQINNKYGADGFDVYSKKAGEDYKAIGRFNDIVKAIRTARDESKQSKIDSTIIKLRKTGEIIVVFRNGKDTKNKLADIASDAKMSNKNEKRLDSASTVTFIITFNENGGSKETTESVTTEVESNKDIRLPSIEEVKYTAPDGKEFDCWEVNGNRKNPNDTIKINTDTEIKAIWKDKPVEETSLKVDSDADSEATDSSSTKSSDDTTADSSEADSIKAETTEETPLDKKNEARKRYTKVIKALKDAGYDVSDLRDGKKVTPKLKELVKAIFTESYADAPFDSDIKEGDKIRIIHLEGEDNSYDGKEGEVTNIDSIGQLHGTWGGLAVIPGVDDFDIITEDLTEAKAKPEGDKVKSYNDGLKLAKLHNKPVIYGYTNSSYGNKFFELDDPIICNNVNDETKKFKQQYKSCNIVYVAYPNGQLIERLLEELPEGTTEIDYVEYKHSYCHALEPKLEELKKIEDIEELKKAILDIINNDPQVNWTKKEKKFAAIVRHKKWKSVEDLKAYLDNSIAKAREIKVSVDTDGELVKKLTEEIEVDENGDEIFTPEEQEEFDCDEWGYSNEGYDQFHHCGWCGEIYPESEMRHEVDFGWICSRCEDELKSHGGPLTFIED